MIKTEKIKKGDKTFYKTYSDTYKIRQVETGVVYTIAIDPIKDKYTYVETHIPLSK